MELWLKYTDENGASRCVAVRAEKFFIGRHSENDLSIPKNQLSRRHAEIDRYEDVFVITDSNSSNGTTLNGKLLERPTALTNGDKLNLGGGIEIEVELISAAPKSPSAALPNEDSSDVSSIEETAANPESAAPVESVAEAQAQNVAPAVAPPTVVAAPKSGMGMIFILAPVLVLVVLAIGGLILLLTGGGSKSGDTGKKRSRGDFIYSDDEEDKKDNKKSNDSDDKIPTPALKNDDGNQSANSSPTPVASSTASTGDTPPPAASPVSSETEMVEKNALAFLRRIAQTDANSVLTQKQIDLINRTTKTFRGSSALRDNLQSLKKNSAQIESLAKAKNLRAQFLAAAALAKIGNAKGDPLATAQSIAGDLSGLSNLIGNDFSDDSLMIIAAFEEGGINSKMPAMLANMSGKSADARRIRTIWFLHDNKKISDAQYNFAVQFLAIGAIMQNPKDFNVQTEAVIFN